MNKILIILFAATLLMAGCHKKQSVSSEQQAEDTIATPVITFDTVAYHTYPDSTPSIAMDICLQLPVEDDAIPVTSVLRRNIVADVLGEKYLKEGDADRALKAYVRDLQKRFVESMAEFDVDIDDDGMSSMFNWESMLHTNVVLYSPQIIVTKTQFYDYTGGAHGFGGDNYSVYSVVTGKMQKLSDVFRSDKATYLALEQQLKAKLNELIANSEEYGDMEIMSPENVKPVENFNVTPEGITFVYLPYDIAAYCYGQISVTLPIAEIRPYLLDDSPVAHYYAEGSGQQLAASF